MPPKSEVQENMASSRGTRGARAHSLEVRGISGRPEDEEERARRLRKRPSFLCATGVDAVSTGRINRTAAQAAAPADPGEGAFTLVGPGSNTLSRDGTFDARRSTRRRSVSGTAAGLEGVAKGAVRIGAAGTIGAVRIGAAGGKAAAGAAGKVAKGTVGHVVAPQKSEQKLREEAWLLELLTAAELKGVILPFSRFRTSWDMVILLFVIYTAVTLPIQLAYPDAPDTFNQLADFELVMDILFLVDIGLNFRTSYVQNAELNVNKKKIAQKYFSGWFPIDLAGSLPWEITFRIIAAVSTDDTIFQGDFLTLFKILKVPKLLRLGRFFKALEKFEGAANVGRIFFLMLILVIFVHWIACLWSPPQR